MEARVSGFRGSGYLEYSRLQLGVEVGFGVYSGFRFLLGMASGGTALRFRTLMKWSLVVYLLAVNSTFQLLGFL